MSLTLLPPPLLLFLTILLTSCAGGKDDQAPDPNNAKTFDVSLDSANSSLFFSGRASSTSLLNRKGKHSLWFTLNSQPGSAANEASARLVDNHGHTIIQRASYISDNGQNGEISLLNGRLILRGKTKQNGLELEGTWYFDGQPGGTFWIAPQGSIFN